MADAGRFAVSDRRTEAVYGGAAVLYAAGWEVKGAKMKHYIVRFEVAMFVAADDSQSAVFDAKMKLNDIDGIECAEDTDVCTLEELLGRTKKGGNK